MGLCGFAKLDILPSEHVNDVEKVFCNGSTCIAPLLAFLAERIAVVVAAEAIQKNCVHLRIPCPDEVFLKVVSEVQDFVRLYGTRAVVAVAEDARAGLCDCCVEYSSIWLRAANVFAADKATNGSNENGRCPYKGYREFKS